MSKPNFKPTFDLRPSRPHFAEAVERDIVVEPEASAEADEPLIYRNIVSTCSNVGWANKVVDRATYRAPCRAVKIVQADGQWRELPALPAFMRVKGSALPPGHFVSGSTEHNARRRELGWL